MYVYFLAQRDYDYADAYLQSSWEDVAQEVTVTQQVNYLRVYHDCLIWHRMCAM